MTERAAAARSFCDAHGWAGAHWQMLAGDASPRRYLRLQYGSRSAVLMDAPPEHGNDTRPFVTMAELLRGLGLSAPEVYASDLKSGFMLLEDLGDDLFKTVIASTPSQENRLYEGAIDVLGQLHSAKDLPTLTRFTADHMTDLSLLVLDWYPRAVNAPINATSRKNFETALHEVLRPLDKTPEVIALRDYHAENLLWLPDRAGVAQIGLLDFQDAVLAHPGYDLVSVLQDARRDVSEELEADMRMRFCQQNGHDPETFGQDYARLGLQRNLRILGVFARLCLRDGKPQYLAFIPRVWAFVQRNLRDLSAPKLNELITTLLPEPTPEFLERLTEQCATHRDP